MLKKFLLFVLYLFGLSYSSLLFAQDGGVNGTIFDENGKPLPFASIYIKETGQGAATNPEGYYEISLSPGSYQIFYQYLGYETQSETIIIGSEFIEFDVHFEIRDFVLSNLTFEGGDEDPAYSIMRKVIAKSKYHLLQVDSFKTTVYVKGAGRIIDVPFLLRKRMKKEGIDSSRVFLVESISELSFKQPNTYHEKVLSIRSSEDEGTPSPMQYIRNSFYEPKIEEAISPLNPNAFSYYKYRYIGVFEDKEVSVFKIEVIPKVRGDRVFEGYINIIDNKWALHSLELSTIFQGFNINIQQIYEPVEQNAWMPVFHQFKVNGSVLGFKIEFNYVATAKDYKIWLNQDLIYNTSIGSDKKEDPVSNEISEDSGIAIQEKELSNKDMKKILREYEKESRKQNEEPTIVDDTSLDIDSLAYSRDSSYWDEIRPIPLTRLEFSTYEKKDSIILKRKEREEKDSIKREKNRKFRMQHLITGNNYSLSENLDFNWHSVLNTISFNTVDGWNFKTGFDLDWSWDHSNLSLTPVVRYGFSRKTWNWMGDLEYRNRKENNNNSFGLSGGKYISQINEDEPIQYWLNMFTTLLLMDNHLKLYEKSFLKFKYEGTFSQKIGLKASIEWSRRKSLENTTDYTLIKQEEKEYTDNNPSNISLEDTRFESHNASLINIHAFWKPFLKYKINNGKRRAITGSSPEFFIGLKSGVPELLDSRVNYTFLETGGNYGFDFGIANRMDLSLTFGKFLNKENLYFPDFIHFQGNETPLITTDLISSYRLLEYYYLSSNGSYLSFHLFYQFRQLFITQILYARLMGLREDLFFHYLTTPAFEHYYEIGYALDNLFRFLRLETVLQFNGDDYKKTGFRIGIAKIISLE